MNVSYEKIKSLVYADYVALTSLFEDVIKSVSNENEILGREIKKYLCGTSKQIRSCMIFLFSRAISGHVDENVLKLAAAVEVIHNATLIHDDIIDSADIRRGFVTLNKKYSDNLAIISGDFLLSVAMKLLHSLNCQSVIGYFSDCLISLCKGEINQYFAKKRTPNMADYLEKSNTKTASLFVAGLNSLSDISSLPCEKSLVNFAKNFGIAFQIRDDLNNLLDEKNKKPLFSDVENGIYSAPIIFAFGENKDLSGFFVDDIVVKAKEEKNIVATKNLIEKYLIFAKKELENLPNNEYTKALLSLCDILL